MPMLMLLSREVRRVPLDYEPPQDERGHPRPVFDRFYGDALAEWEAGKRRWDTGEDPDRRARNYSWEEWVGEKPDPDFYLPGVAWPEGAVIGIRMYETVTEGTPISRAYPDTEEGRTAMAAELASANTSITSGMTAAEWRQIIDGGLGVKDIHTGEFEIR